MHNIKVRKRDGSLIDIDYEKIHKSIAFCTNGLSNVSISEIAMNCKINFFDGITTKEIHQNIIKSAKDLISEKTPNYQIVAGRALNIDIRKNVYNQYTPPSLYSIITKNVEDGWYDSEILEMYSEDEINKQLTSKYLVQNRTQRDDFKETPQIMYMLIGMTLFGKYKEKRLKYVKSFYNLTAVKQTLGLPTPILAGVRTPTRQFSSCVLGKCGDNLQSISASSKSIIDYVSKRAGIGWDMSAIRPIGSSIRNGEAYHTGIIPFIKHMNSAVQSCSQGGIRGGAATIYYPIWHYEVESLIVLKNNKGTDENRVRTLDHGFAINKHFYDCAINGDDYYLFDVKDTPGLYEAFYSADQTEFVNLYNKYSKKRKIRKQKVNAMELLTRIEMERVSTGRVYMIHPDLMNSQTPFIKDKIYQSNLCLEIALPTADLTKWSSLTTEECLELGIYNKDMSVDDFIEKFGIVSLCTLSNFNFGNIKSTKDFEELANISVRALDELIDYQYYPMIAAEVPTKSFRSVGIGVNGLAHFIAKHKTKYGKQSAELVDEYMEAMNYYLVKTSVELAKEKGSFDWIDRTIYKTDKPFIWEHRKAKIDNIIPMKTRMDWESLRADIKKYGQRHSTLIAHMPSESNSVVFNATNGVEPIRQKMTVKGNGDNVTKQVYPTHLKYDYLWEMGDMRRYIETLAVIQKWTDQSISTNMSYDAEHFDDGTIPLKILLMDILTAYSYGIKTIYYHNSKVNNENNTNSENNTNNEDEGECESCKL